MRQRGLHRRSHGPPVRVRTVVRARGRREGQDSEAGDRYLARAWYGCRSALRAPAENFDGVWALSGVAEERLFTRAGAGPGGSRASRKVGVVGVQGRDDGRLRGEAPEAGCGLATRGVQDVRAGRPRGGATDTRRTTINAEKFNAILANPAIRRFLIHSFAFWTIKPS